MNADYRPVAPNFAAVTRHARKVLAIEIAGLGDLVQSLPALWAIRQGYPDAQIHCLVHEANASLLRLTPWIDRVIPCRRGNLGGLNDRLKMARELRSGQYDVAIDLIGSESSSILARVTGAPRRLIRRPEMAATRYGWLWFHTDIMECEFHQSPMYLQRLQCVEQAGFKARQPIFAITEEDVDPFSRNAVRTGAEAYIHLSPYTELAYKELAPDQLAQLILRLRHHFPRLRLVLTCSSKPRERSELDRLLHALPFRPWKVFAGTLDIPQLYTLIKDAALHLGGDTGTMHLAWLAGTPSVSWFREFGDFSQWAPQGMQHAVVTSPQQQSGHLCGIDNKLIVAGPKRLWQRLSHSVAPIGCNRVFKLGRRWHCFRRTRQSDITGQAGRRMSNRCRDS